MHPESIQITNPYICVFSHYKHNAIILESEGSFQSVFWLSYLGIQIKHYVLAERILFSEWLFNCSSTPALILSIWAIDFPCFLAHAASCAEEIYKLFGNESD